MKTIEFLKSGGTIEQLHEQYKIKARAHSEHPNLMLFKYDQIESPMAADIVQECRGVIIDMDTLKVVSRPFDKFFNHGEVLASRIDWKTAAVQEKLDGSLMTMYWYNEQWQVATSGTPDACAPVGAHDMTFKDLFWKVFKDHNYELPVDTNKCYVFELMTPYNRVVVRHDFNQLKLIGARDLLTMQEIDIQKESFGFQPVGTFNNLSDFAGLDATFSNIDPVRQEGYVVVDAGFNRVKVKHPGYVLLHRAKDGLSTRRIVDIIKTGESTEVLAHFPEWQAEFDRVLEKYNEFVDYLYESWGAVSHLETQKEFALAIENVKMKSALFARRAKKVNTFKEFLASQRTDTIIEAIGLDK